MKRTFADKNNVHWTPVITLYHAAKIKRELNINIEDFDQITEIVSNPMLLCDALYIACEEEAAKKDVSAETFGKSLGADSLKSAREALVMAISDFFEDSRTQTLFLATMETAVQEGEKMMEKIIANVDAIKEKIRSAASMQIEKFQKEMEKTNSGPTSGDSPELPESATRTG